MSADHTRPRRRPRHGLRHAGEPRRRRALLHAHPPRPPADARAADRAAGALQRDRRHLAAARDHAGAGRRHRRRRWRRPSPAASSSSLGQKHTAPVHRGRRRRAARHRRRAHRRPRARAALLDDEHRPVRRPRDRRRRGDRVPVSVVRSWHLEPGYLDLLTGYVGDAIAQVGGAEGCDVLFTAHSLPAAHPASRATRTRTSSPRRPRRSPSARGSSAGRSPGRARGAPRIRGSGPDVLDVLRERWPPRARARSSSARAASSPTISRCSTTSTSRPQALADELGIGVRAHRLAERRPGVHADARRHRPRRTLASRPPERSPDEPPRRRRRRRHRRARGRARAGGRARRARR